MAPAPCIIRDVIPGVAGVNLKPNKILEPQGFNLLSVFSVTSRRALPIAKAIDTHVILITCYLFLSRQGLNADWKTSILDPFPKITLIKLTYWLTCGGNDGAKNKKIAAVGHFTQIMFPGCICWWPACENPHSGVVDLYSLFVATC